MRKLLFTALFFMCITSTAFAGDLTIKLTDFRNAGGNVMISIFNEKEAFENVIPEKIHTFVSIKADGTDKEVMLKNFPAGNYAITILHDENKNMDMDLNSQDFPVEGYGFSNNVGTMSEPTFKDAAFSHDADKTTNQTIKIIYIM